MKKIVKKRLYGEEIKQILMQAILEGRLKPGERIVETQWAKKLGVSQAPVREAIKQLESINLLENIPFQGAFVCQVTPKDMRDAYIVRLELESLGAKDAVKYVTDKKLIPIKKALDTIETAAASGDFIKYIEQDVVFHQLIMELSPNQFLLKLWQFCNIKEWTVLGTRWSQLPLETLGYRHQAIYDALVNRDEEMLIKECRQHTYALIQECENGQNSLQK